jgi:hypothetical protein
MNPLDNRCHEMPTVQSRRLCPVMPHEIEKSNISFSSTRPEEPFVVVAPEEKMKNQRLERKPSFQRANATKVRFHPTVHKPVRYKHIESNGELPKPLESSLIYDSKRGSIDFCVGGQREKAPLTLNNMYSDQMDN